MKLLRLALPLILFASVAHAHPGHDGHDFSWSFSGGFLHPLTGWDHLAAMLSVGVWAGILGGRARWALPAAFVGTMAIAAILAKPGSEFTGLEQGIAASVVALVIIVAFRVRMPLMLATGLVAAFAVFHGWAHGAEMPSQASAIQYLGGFVLATALLHAAGLGLYSFSHYIARRQSRARA